MRRVYPEPSRVLRVLKVLKVLKVLGF